jgi:hypothetical protein
MRHNPHYENFFFWTPENIPYHLMNTASVRILKSEAHYCIKSDVMRWEVLRIYGGIITDTDVQCLKCFDPLLNDKSFCARSYHDNNYGNAIVGSEPDNPMCQEIIEALTNGILENWNDANSRNSYKYGVLLVVPFLVQCDKIYEKEIFYPFSWSDVTRKDGNKAHTNYPDSYAVHWWAGGNPGGWVEDFKKRDLSGTKPPYPQKLRGT